MTAAERFGKFVLLEKIAAGGMAEIFRAKTYGVSGFEKAVAVKRILPHLSEDETFINMLIDEAKIAGKLTHQNIAQIYDLGRVQDTYFIAMEYVQGKDLGRVMRKCIKTETPLPRPHALYIALQACTGLAYAHTRKDNDGQPLHIIHRDVSPQNVLVSYDGQIKLVDFGIAKAANKMTQTQHGEIKGKFSYMSPEQARGEDLDNRSDVFAAGILLHEMLTGARAFFHSSEAVTLRSVQEGKFRTFEELSVKVDEDLKAIVYRALAHDRELRYPDAGAMAADLTRYLYTREPGYRPEMLAEWMHELFAKEVAREEERRLADSQIGELPVDAQVPGGDLPPTVLTPYSRRALLQAELDRTPLSGVSAVSELSFVEVPRQRRTLAIALIAGAILAVVGAAIGSYLLQGASTGGLRIDSDPQGLLLVIDGQERAQRTPALIQGFAPGPHTVEVVHRDGRRWTTEVEVQAGILAQVSAPALPALVGRLKVTSTAPRSIILLDGKEVGVAPADLPDIAAGEHAVTARARGYADATRQVTVEADKIAELVLEPSPAAAPAPSPKPRRRARRAASRSRATGLVDINAVPWAKIFVDGRDTGRTTPATGLKLPVGTHRIRLRNPDAGLEKTVTVEVTKGERLKIVERLQ